MTESIVALIGFLSALVTGLLGHYFGKKTTDAEITKVLAESNKIAAESQTEEIDAASKITDAALSLLPALTEKVERLEKRVTELEEAYKKERTQRLALSRRLSDFRQGINKLIEQIKSQGLDPAWVPEPADSVEKAPNL